MQTSELICSANQLTGFYMMAALMFNELMATFPNSLITDVERFPKMPLS